jgi:cytochrome c551
MMKDSRILKKQPPFFFTNCLLFTVYCSLISCQSKEKILLEQYYINGKELYETHCANCHQKDGKGLGLLYPPIAGSDFLKNKNQIFCLIKNGISGEMVINGKTYNQAMPANKQLLDLDIAEISTYIYTEWGNEKVITETDSVHQVLEKCRK